MNDAQMKEFLVRIQRNLRITKVIATRSIKGKNGDSFAGYSAAWDSVQEDGAKGFDTLADAGADADRGMSMKEARVAHYLLAMQADISAHEAALAGGNISPDFCRDAVASIKRNYGKLIRAVLGADICE